MPRSFAFTPRTASLLVGLLSAAILISVLVMQYGFGAAPCQLCIWQRYPHLALVLLGVVGFLAWPRRALLAAGVVALGSAGLALYHLGIEQGFWALPAGCVAGGKAASVDELRRLLMESPPACDQVSFTLFGMSLALWNAAASLLLAVLALLGLAEPVRAVRRVPQ